MRIEIGRRPKLTLVRDPVDESPPRREEEKTLSKLSKKAGKYYAQAHTDSDRFLDSALPYVYIDPYAQVFIESCLRRNLTSRAIRADINPMYAGKTRRQDRDIVKNHEDKFITRHATLLFDEEDKTSEKEARLLAWDISNKILDLGREPSPNREFVRSQIALPCTLLNRVVGLSPHASTHKPE